MMCSELISAQKKTLAAWFVFSCNFTYICSMSVVWVCCKGSLIFLVLFQKQSLVRLIALSASSAAACRILVSEQPAEGFYLQMLIAGFKGSTLCNVKLWGVLTYHSPKLLCNCQLSKFYAWKWPQQPEVFCFMTVKLKVQNMKTS